MTRAVFTNLLETQNIEIYTSRKYARCKAEWGTFSSCYSRLNTEISWLVLGFTERIMLPESAPRSIIMAILSKDIVGWLLLGAIQMPHILTLNSKSVSINKLYIKTYTSFIRKKKKIQGSCCSVRLITGPLLVSQPAVKEPILECVTACSSRTTCLLFLMIKRLFKNVTLRSSPIQGSSEVGCTHSSVSDTH